MRRRFVIQAAVILLALIFTAGLGLAAEKKVEKKTETTTVEKKTLAGDKIDINSAEKEDLLKLPGVGEATAQKIIDGRPYKSKDQLKSKKIISASEYDKIKDNIVARQKKK